MDWAEIGTQIFLGILSVVVSAVGVLVTHLINKHIKNDTVKQYVNSLNVLVKECVQEVYQIYVDALKKSNAFDKEAQEHALQLCLDKINEKLPADLKKWLEDNYSDIQGYLTTLIESTIYYLKVKNKLK